MVKSRIKRRATTPQSSPRAKRSSATEPTKVLQTVIDRGCFGEGVSRHVRPDLNPRSRFHRLANLRELIETRGGFQRGDAVCVLTRRSGERPMFATKAHLHAARLPQGFEDASANNADADAVFVEVYDEPSGQWRTGSGLELAAKRAAIARWLSVELSKTRHSESKPGAAPVLRAYSGMQRRKEVRSPKESKLALSRLTIADIAMSMVEQFSDELGDELICLLQELLGVDRHRKTVAKSRSDRFRTAVTIVAQYALRGRTFGVNELARLVSVSHQTIVAWNNSAAFQENVAGEQDYWDRYLRDRYFPVIKTEKPDISDQEAFARAFEMCGSALGPLVGIAAPRPGDRR
jgi:hypothetical protein